MGFDLLHKPGTVLQGDKPCEKIGIGRVTQAMLQFIGKNLKRTEFEKRRDRIVGDIRNQALAWMQQQRVRRKNNDPVDDGVEY